MPVVINMPGPISLSAEMGTLKLPDVRNSTSCCGVICLTETLKQLMTGCILKMVLGSTVANGWNNMQDHIVLCNSFWGLDRALSIPPNIIMTGPLSKPQGDLVQKLQEKDPELFEWLNNAEGPVVYISLGSMVKW